jgi:hypothetical protein
MTPIVEAHGLQVSVERKKVRVASLPSGRHQRGT